MSQEGERNVVRRGRQSVMGEPSTSTGFVECDMDEVPTFVSVRSCETTNYTNNSLLGRVLAMARRVMLEDEGENGLLAQIFRNNPLHLLTPEKLLLVRRILATMCTADMSRTVEKLLNLLSEK